MDYILQLHHPKKKKKKKDGNSKQTPYPFKFFKGCLPQFLFCPFLNTLFQVFLPSIEVFVLHKEQIWSTTRDLTAIYHQREAMESTCN